MITWLQNDNRCRCWTNGNAIEHSAMAIIALKESIDRTATAYGVPFDTAFNIIIDSVKKSEKSSHNHDGNIKTILKDIAFTIVIEALLYLLSWIVICVYIKLITLCLGLSFSWSAATGIWMVIGLLQCILPTTNSKRKNSADLLKKK